MTFQTTVTTALLTVTATTVSAEDPEHVYSTVVVSPPEPDWFERNAVGATFGPGTAIEVDEVEGRVTLRMLDADARTLAAALATYFGDAAATEPDDVSDVTGVGPTALGQGVTHGDHAPHRA